MQVSIVIVNYNVKYFLEQCLCSVKQAIKQIDAEIIVVDNASSDNSITYLQPLFPEVQFVQNNSNLGYAKACNQGYRLAKGEYVLFLNPDTMVAEQCFHECISFLKTHADCGALGVRMIDGSGKFLAESKRSFPSPLISFFKLIGLATLFPSSRFFNKYALGNLNENEIHVIEVLAGAFFMTTKKLLERLNGFDESFFMYGEDIDLSYRIHQAGFKNYYLGTTTILHFKGESSRRAGMNYVKMFYSAMNVFVKKHYSKAQSILFSFFIYLLTIFKSIFFCIEKTFKRFSLHQRIVFKRTGIVGSKEQCQLVSSVLKKNQLTITELLVIKDEADGKDLFLPLQTFIQLNNIEEIIFCEGDTISYSQIFSTISKIKHPVCFWFHAFNSKSVVRSHFKNLPGKAIA